MFGLGHWELLIILVILFVILAVVIGVIFLFIVLLKPKNTGPPNTQSERLKELQNMKDNDLMTEDEYNKKRREILSNL